MPSIFPFSRGPQDWQSLLADPVKHWRRGYSARTLAHSWEDAQGFPAEVAGVFAASVDPLLVNLAPVLAIPEFKVPLPGGSRPSQSDIFVLARADAGPITIMVEGKVREPFGQTVGDWLAGASDGKRARLRFLQEQLGLDGCDNALRYQLLHRATSAIVVGTQYRAAAAIMLVHSFCQERSWWDDYRAFTAAFGIQAECGVLQRLGKETPIPFFAAWVVGDPKYLEA